MHILFFVIVHLLSTSVIFIWIKFRTHIFAISNKWLNFKFYIIIHLPWESFCKPENQDTFQILEWNFVLPSTNVQLLLLCYHQKLIQHLFALLINDANFHQKFVCMRLFLLPQGLKCYPKPEKKTIILLSSNR